MAIQYSRVDKKNLDNAVAKAKKVKPMVKVLGFGKFEVTGSKGEPYNVEFSKEGGEFTFSCTCTAHKKNLVCYHTVSCSSIFKKQVKDRAVTKAAPVAQLPAYHKAERASICPECGLDNCDMPGGDDGLEYCYNCGAELPVLEVAS
jgi:hypothetical protein